MIAEALFVVLAITLVLVVQAVEVVSASLAKQEELLLRLLALVAAEHMTL